MRVLVVGSGGREHALCWALRRDLDTDNLFCAPGNPGTAEIAINLPIGVNEHERLIEAAASNAIELVIIGPEAPLANGLADRMRMSGLLVFGPSAGAARIESSKAFAKEVMAAAEIPTASGQIFTELGPALGYVDRHSEPLVVKASGLAAGKGAIVCATREEARRALTAMLREGKFGDAGKVVVVESFLQGEELSLLAISNGMDLAILPAAQDHKRLLDRDLGPNTGGMGAYSPVSLATEELVRRVERKVLRPVLEELARRYVPFTGVLYAGLMIDDVGQPSVIEFNCRLGDPEAQTILPRVTSSILEAFLASARAQPLPSLQVTEDSAVTTVLASAGYPEEPRRGDPIQIPGNLPESVLLFQAGTQRDEKGMLRTNGGRVLAVTAVAPSFIAAQKTSRAAAEAIQFEGKQMRTDIGYREARRRGA